MAGLAGAQGGVGALQKEPSGLVGDSPGWEEYGENGVALVQIIGSGRDVLKSQQADVLLDISEPEGKRKRWRTLGKRRP